MTTAVVERETARALEKADSAEESKRDLQHFLALDYPIELVKDEDSYVASHPDLPGCVSFGDNPSAAVERLRSIKKLWIEGQLQSGNRIPEPSEDEQFSGKFVLRLPKGLHRMADLRARREGVSLNAFINNIVAGALGYGKQTPHFDLIESNTLADQFEEISGWCSAVPWIGKGLGWEKAHQRSAKNVRQLHSGFVGTLASQILTHQETKFVPDQSIEEYFHAKETPVRRKSSSGL